MIFRCSGHSNLPRKISVLAALLIYGATPAMAFEPVEALDAVWVENAFADHGLEQQGWTQPAWSSAQGVELRQLLDEQIFTELSPILESGETIRLPQDQLLTD